MAGTKVLIDNANRTDGQADPKTACQFRFFTSYQDWIVPQRGTNFNVRYSQHHQLTDNGCRELRTTTTTTTTMTQNRSFYLFLLVALVVAGSTHGFSTRPPLAVTSKTFTRTAPKEQRILSSMRMAKNEGGADNKLDYVQIAGMLLNPLNPYSWFLYFFIFIFGYNAIQQ